jgi:hypothetical protein
LFELGFELDLTFGRQVLCHLNYAPSPYFALVIFQIGTLHFFAQSWPWTVILLIYASCIAGITGARHYTQLVEIGVSPTFFLGCHGTPFLLVFTS